MSEPPPTVFIVDDDDAVRDSLRLLFKSLGLPTLGFGSADDFLAAYDPDLPGCLVLDVRMPNMSGLELQRKLSLRGAMIPVIFISGHGDIPMAVEAMQYGAFDFLQKPFRAQELLDRVQRAIERDAENRAAVHAIETVRERLRALTPREREVLDLVVHGRANKAIAGELGVSQRTVEIHRAHVMEKMEARSLAQLVRMIMGLERLGA